MRDALMNWILWMKAGRNFTSFIGVLDVREFLLPNGAPSAFTSNIVHALDGSVSRYGVKLEAWKEYLPIAKISWATVVEEEIPQ
jgi:hypothetical protein